MADPNAKDLDFTETPCAACDDVSTENERMIGCDGCQQWFHIRCVGITSEAELEKKWFCADDKCQQAKKKKKTSRAKKNGDESDRSSVKSDAALTLEQKLKAMEEGQKRQEQEMDAEMILKRKENEIRQSLERRRMLLEKQMREEEEEREKQLQEEILRERRMQLERMRARQRSFEASMKSLDDEMAKLKCSSEKQKLKQDADVGEGVSGANRTPLRNPEVGKLTEQNVEKLKNTRIEGSEEETDTDDDDEGSDTDDSDEEDSASGKESKVSSVGKASRIELSGKARRNIDNLSQHGLGQPRLGPTKVQLAARSAISKKLPTFSGKPEEWPLFYGTYQASNEACGYTDVENLVRLQECLKGPALEMVQGQLLLPKSVPKVIVKLRQLYGRPEQLLQSHLEKVRRLEPPKAGKLASFIPFGTAVEQLCEHLEAADLKQHLVNPLLVQDLVDKLPDNDKREWVRFKRGKKKVTLRTLTDFLSEIVSEACEANVSFEYKPVNKPIGEGRPSAGSSRSKGAMFNHSEVESQTYEPPTGGVERKHLKPCRVCNRTDHRLRYCQDFRNLAYPDRLKVVEQWKLCQVCLNEHGAAQCKFKLRCNVGECRQAHNSLLHPIDSVVGTSAHIRTKSVMMFRMIPVRLHCGNKSITVLAFLDEGASVTLVERRLADRLGVVGVHEKLTIQWTADIERVERNSTRTNVWVSAIGGEDKMLLTAVHTVSKLMLPAQTLDAKELSQQYRHLRGLPISSYSGRPEMLIGLNNLHSFAPREAKIGTVAEPIAVRCQLGWTVYGPKLSSTAAAVNGYMNVHQGVTNEDLHDLLKNHYAVEESVVTVQLESADEKRAREILERTTKRVGDRFETGLLWKTDDPSFPDSYPMALRRLKQLEKKLEKNSSLQQNVRTQIVEYQRKGYAHLATPNELAVADPNKVWYLPLNVVLNPKKPDKIRLVWDAAATVQGMSLNSQLLKGPDMLVPLVSVIVGFREHRVAIGGDLREMYHQIKIIDEDKQFQRFLFRDDPQETPRVYIMDVATFGSTSSPCSAQYVKNCNAEEYAEQFPEAAAAIVKRHYVDDYFDSVDTIEEAISRAKEVKFVHQKGGFEIRNWVSNSPEVLQSLGEQQQVSTVHFAEDKGSIQERVLGMIWNPQSDEFSFSTKSREQHLPYFSGEKRPTKRAVLSCVMGFFDPLGLLAPFTIHGRIIVQQLWRSGCEWDEAIDDECWEMWKRWIGLLPEVENIRIPRCYLGRHSYSEAESVEVHIFTDASEHAYGCVAFLRVNIGGVIRCSLAMSRSKVAPLKKQSIPRLELMAAVLGARMSRTMTDTHSLKISRCVLWTDSRTVWSWIRADQHQYKQFVAFRIGEILELTRASDWRWVPTKQNLADVLTKWQHGTLNSESEWFRGAPFLYEPEDQWPTLDVPIEKTSEEAKGFVSFHCVVDVDRCSRWTTLQRVTAYVIRFIENCKRKVASQQLVTVRASKNQQRMILAQLPSTQRSLEKEELQKAEVLLWKQAQHDRFPDEISLLSKNLNKKSGGILDSVKKTSCLYKLSPVLDDDGVLRMGGRMEMSEEMPFDKKFPIILPRKHATTAKVIQFYHEKFAHANRETVTNELRQRFWIPNIRTAVRQVVNECVWCKVYRCRPQPPLMAPLPAARMTAYVRPFHSVGVDYLGPIEVTVGRRKEKRWVAVFTCLAIRAVHLEIVASLSTQSCLMAIRRFSCRRGVPSEIYSDNATCFKGANNEMRRIHGECSDRVVTAATAWHFNPPASPHMGGIWERMVRSVKEAMKALDDGRTLSDEVLITTIVEAEDMINARPLTYMPQEPTYGEAITPNHFLRGSVTSADTIVDETVNTASSLRDSYKRSQQLANQMWERWLKEYLPLINRRTKWFEDKEPIQLNDLVFLVDGKHRKNWIRGIVEDVIPGPDGRVRQVIVRTGQGSYRRAVANLAVLEIR
ncbi:uncharacterized protein LOC134286454 [Aedes albopictus]|uniref:Uncharacterized protein n=1 Tax=Aedes albopictus TaxID=7160 RepID=A0ABM2A4S5_AEDAL